MSHHPAEQRRVYAKVVADFVHPGHIRFFKAARALGSHLTVCVVPDERVLEFKGITPTFSTNERAEMVAACRWVDVVITDGPIVTTPAFMSENRFDVYAFGAKDDAELEGRLAGCPELPEDMRMVIPYTPEISSTLIRRRFTNHT
jgi:cytidyltransferase-like protein